MSSAEQKRALQLKKKGRNRISGSVVTISMRATIDTWYAIDELLKTAGSKRILFEHAIDAIYELLDEDTVADGGLTRIRQLRALVRMEQNGGTKQQQGTVISIGHNRKVLEIMAKVVNTSRTEVVLAGISMLKKKSDDRFHVPKIEHKKLIYLLQDPLCAEWGHKLTFGERFRPISEISNAQPLLIDAWIVLFAILGRQEANKEHPIPFSPSASQLLFNRAAVSRIPTMISVLELSRLLEYLQRAKKLAKVHPQTDRKGWRPEQQTSDLQILLDSVLKSFLKIVDVTKEDCEAAALYCGSDKKQNVTYPRNENGGDGLLQIMCAKRLHPAGFAIATCSNNFDHANRAMFPVFKPDDLGHFSI